MRYGVDASRAEPGSVQRTNEPLQSARFGLGLARSSAQGQASPAGSGGRSKHQVDAELAEQSRRRREGESVGSRHQCAWVEEEDAASSPSAEMLQLDATQVQQ